MTQTEKKWILACSGSFGCFPSQTHSKGAGVATLCAAKHSHQLTYVSAKELIYGIVPPAKPHECT